MNHVKGMEVVKEETEDLTVLAAYDQGELISPKKIEKLVIGKQSKTDTKQKTKLRNLRQQRRLTMSPTLEI